VFSFATAEGRIADILRTRVAPVLFPKVIAFEAVREYIFRTVSQITLNYRGCPLSTGSAGHDRNFDKNQGRSLAMRLLVASHTQGRQPSNIRGSRPDK